MTERPYITCRELIDFIADYLDGALSSESKSDFERHLSRCESCRAYLQSYEQTIRASRAAMTEREDLLEEAPEDLIQAILESRRQL